jgi:hypothetical protein
VSQAGLSLAEVIASDHFTQPSQADKAKAKRALSAQSGKPLKRAAKGARGSVDSYSVVVSGCHKHNEEKKGPTGYYTPYLCTTSSLTTMTAKSIWQDAEPAVQAGPPRSNSNPTRSSYTLDALLSSSGKLLSDEYAAVPGQTWIVRGQECPPSSLIQTVMLALLAVHGREKNSVSEGLLRWESIEPWQPWPLSLSTLSNPNGAHVSPESVLVLRKRFIGMPGYGNAQCGWVQFSAPPHV